MDIFSIECFITLADTGSFTKTACHLKRTQSAITQQISNLEKKLGVQLFNRGKKVSLTNNGELFLSYALRIYGLHQEVVDRFRNPDLDGEIRVGVPEDFATLFLADVLIDFSRIHPRVFMSVECDLSMNLMQRFKDGLLDLAIVKMSSPKDLPGGVEIWREPLVWVGKHDWSLDGYKNLPLQLVLSPEPCIYRTRALAALEKVNIPWRIVYTSPSHAGIIAAVKASIGLTVLPLTIIPGQLQRVVADFLPSLPDVHVSLLKRESQSKVPIETLERFILEKLMR